MNERSIPNDKMLGIDPDMRRWMDRKSAIEKSNEKYNPIQAARLQNREKEDARMWARQYMRREDILNNSSEVERGYLRELCAYIRDFGLTAESLGVPSERLAEVVGQRKTAHLWVAK